MNHLRKFSSSRQSEKNVPDYTLRKKYTKRPANVVKIRLNESSDVPKLPTEEVDRLWTAIDGGNIEIKTWKYNPLPDISNFFNRLDIDNIAIEFNIGPHPDDGVILNKISLLQTSSFSLEFREQWAGPFPKNEDTDEPDSTSQLCFAYSDSFLESFFKNDMAAVKVSVLTGRLSRDAIRQLPCMSGLKFLGLRVNYEEYLELTEIIPLIKGLERIHLFPQWNTPKGLNIPPLRFLGVITLYYWNLDTTMEIKKSIAKWKSEQRTGRGFKWNSLCCASPT